MCHACAKVLIIDDEPWSREVVKSLGAWQSLQLEVIGEAEDGTEGLRLIAELKPDIVVTDMRMPGIDGVELLREMHERFPSLKIIVMSGFDDFVYLKQAIRSRVVEYLMKPIDPEELNASLARCSQELIEDQGSANPLDGSALLFTDPAVLDEYLALRRKVYGYLLELNGASIPDAFAKLERFLQSALREEQDGNMLSQISHDFLLMLEEFAAENQISRELLKNDPFHGGGFVPGTDALSGVIDELRRLYLGAVDAVAKLSRSRNGLDLAEVQAYIEQHFQDQISLETIARRFFISKEHLSRAFKTFSGENISDYITRKRMEKARDMILGQGLEIKRAAQLTGYEDLAYFYRVFKKHFGLTPGELRRED